MRLAEFITTNREPILMEWEKFARSCWPGPPPDPVELRDHAAEILRATAEDMQSRQSRVQQRDKSKGDGDGSASSDRVDRASVVHAADRVNSGFSLDEVIAEYRALRASVIRLWSESFPYSEPPDLLDLTRFNESIDQSVTEAVHSYTKRVEWSRQMFLAILGHDLRNPLNSIVLSAKALPEICDLPADAVEITATISSSALAMSKMIADLQDFTGISLGVSMPLSPVAMDLDHLCHEVIDETQATIPSRLLRYQSQGDLTGIWDPVRVRQLLSNLLGNAIQHGTGPVEMSATAHGSDVRLCVHNDGPPIPENVLPRIFDAMVQGAARREAIKRARKHGAGALHRAGSRHCSPWHHRSRIHRANRHDVYRQPPSESTRPSKYQAVPGCKVKGGR